MNTIVNFLGTSMATLNLIGLYFFVIILAAFSWVALTWLSNQIQKVISNMKAFFELTSGKEKAKSWMYSFAFLMTVTIGWIGWVVYSNI